MIKGVVEISNDRFDIFVTPPGAGDSLPSPDLQGKRVEISHQALLAPVSLFGMAGKAMRVVKKLAPFQARLWRPAPRHRLKSARRQLHAAFPSCHASRLTPVCLVWPRAHIFYFLLPESYEITIYMI